MAKAKLHEVIASEKDAKSKAQSIISETVKVFKKPENFQAFVKTYKPRNEEGTQFPEERKELVTTVKDRLNFSFKHLSNLYNLLGRKAATNQLAKADLVVDGVTIAEQVPATLLLDLEKEFRELLHTFRAIPTLQSDVAWEDDPAAAKNVVRTKHPEERIRQERQKDFRIISEATKEHKAQIAEVEKTIDAGMWTTQFWSGMISSAEKSRMIENIELLLVATKKARTRANNQEVVDFKLGQSVKEFVLNHEPVQE